MFTKYISAYLHILQIAKCTCNNRFCNFAIKECIVLCHFYLWLSLKNFKWWIKTFLSLFWCSLSWAQTFRMVDIEINAWSSLFLNLETNLIWCLYTEKCIKFNQSEWRIRSREIWNFARHIQKREGLTNFEKPVFVFSVLY